MIREDWLIRQIKTIGDVIARIVFNKAEIVYEIHDEANHTETDMLFLKLTKMLDDNKINKAENLLFDMLNPSDVNYLTLAVDFYQRVNEKSDDELELCGFSRSEIESGLNEIMIIFGITL